MIGRRSAARRLDLAGAARWLAAGMSIVSVAGGCRSSAPDAASAGADATATGDATPGAALHGAAVADATPPSASAAPMTRAAKEQNALAILAGDPTAGEIAESTDGRYALPAAPSAASLTIGVKVVAGDADAFHPALLSIKPAEKRCYQRGLQDDANMQGKVRVQVAVDAKGEVATAVLLNGGLSSPTARCCAAVLQRAVEAFQGPKVTQAVVEFAFVKNSD